MRSPSNYTTQDLLARAGEGSAEAWNELYARYHDFLLASVRKRVEAVPALSFEHEDVLQSAFLSAYEHLEGFEYRGEGSLKRWLVRIVTNNTIEKLRKQSKERQSLPPGKRRNVSQVLDEGGAAPSEVVSTAENEARLMECIEELPGRLREVVVLRDFEELGWDEVAEKVGAANSTARDRYREAWARLSRRMNDLTGTDAASD